MNLNKQIVAVGSSKLRTADYSFKASNISPASAGNDIDPVLSIDHFEIRTPKFPPHPHAGFSAVTYLFKDGNGEFVSRDSTGGYHTATPGAVIWNVAGNGVIHEEYPKEGGFFHGLQMFINLSSQDKKLAPHVLFADGPNVPEYQDSEKLVRIVSGEYNGIAAAIAPPGEVTYLDIYLEAEKTFQTKLPPENAVLLYVISGKVIIDGSEVTELKTASMDINGNVVTFSASAEKTHVVLIAAKPLKEPVVSHGPFTMNSEQEIQEAFVRYHGGEMGQLLSTNIY